MAHHQGMSLLSFAYALLNRPMQKRFEADLQFQATTLLLQERIPRATAFYSQAAEVSSLRTTAAPSEPPFRIFTDPNSSVPEVQLLSNGRYHVMVTHAGGGYSRWKDLAVTRWREDTTRDPWGTFCYVRDTASGEFWSTAYQPTLDRPDRYEAIFAEARVQFRRRDGNFDTHTEIAVSPEDDIELRRVTVTNHALTRRRPSRSPATPKWCSRRPPPTLCIPPSAISSCRPKFFRSARPSCARAARVPSTNRSPGCFT